MPKPTQTATITNRSSSATHEQRAKRAASAASGVKLGPAWRSQRSSLFFPEMPDRDLMPDDDTVLAAYDAAAATIEYGKAQEARLKEIPEQIEKLRAEHDAALQQAIEKKQTKLPQAPAVEIAQLEAELQTIEPSIHKIRAQAWAKRQQFAATAAPLMTKLVPTAVADLEGAVSQIEDLLAKLDEQIDKAHHAQGRIRYSESFVESPGFPVGNLLNETRADLREKVSHLRSYAARVRKER